MTFKKTFSHSNQENILVEIQDLIDSHVHEACGGELCANPMVSVVVFTFNDKNFIRESLDSVFCQQVNFPYEVIITDDCSTDGTTEIIRSYQNLHPDKTRLLIADRNLWNPLPGVSGLTPLAGLQACRGKYIALTHGDDYWTDPLKLQKQVDFLEANPDFAICFHNVQVVNLIYPEKSYLINSNNTKNISTLEDLLEGVNYIGTTSMMLKAATIPNPLPLWFSQLTFGDYGLSILCASQGKIKYINQVMGVYRVHSSGIYGQLTHSSDPLKRLKSSKTNVEFWWLFRNGGVKSPK